MHFFFGTIFPIAAKAQAVSLIDAISNGQTHFDAQLRYEYVDQLGMVNDANATTLRTKINYQTKRFNGVSALIEFENITNLFDSNFNDYR